MAHCHAVVPVQQQQYSQHPRCTDNSASTPVVGNDNIVAEICKEGECMQVGCRVGRVGSPMQEQHTGRLFSRPAQNERRVKGNVIAAGELQDMQCKPFTPPSKQTSMLPVSLNGKICMLHRDEHHFTSKENFMFLFDLFLLIAEAHRQMIIA